MEPLKFKALTSTVKFSATDKNVKKAERTSKPVVQKNTTIISRKKKNRVPPLEGTYRTEFGKGIIIYTSTIPPEPLLTYEDVIAFDRANPSSIVHIHPPLYSEFIHNISGLIDSKVYVHQIVETTKKYKDDYPPSKVIKLDFINLGNMTAIKAYLENGNSHLSYYLKLANPK